MEPESNDREQMDYQLRRVGVIVGWMIIVAGAFYTLYQARGVFQTIFRILTPFLVAAVAAYILHPLVTGCQNRLRLNRLWAVITVYALVFLMAGGFVAIFGGILSRQILSAVSAGATTIPNLLQNVLFPRQLGEDDILDYSAFLQRLQTAADPASAFLWDAMSVDLQEQVRDSDKASTVPEPLRLQTLDFLNSLIRERDFYSEAPDVWDGDDISDAALRQTEMAPDERQSPLLNRMLLEEAFPDLIRPVQLFGGLGQSYRHSDFGSFLVDRMGDGDYIEGIRRLLPMTRAVLDAVYARLQSLAGNVWIGVNTVMGLMFILLFAMIITAYFLIDIHGFGYFTRVIVPERHEERVFQVLEKIDRAVGGFIRGQIIVCFCVGVMTTVGLLLMGFHTPALARYCLLIGIAAGVANFIPYLGPVMAAVPSILIVLLSTSAGDEVTFQYRIMGVAGVLLVSAVANGVEGLVLQPYVVGGASNLSPMVVLLALLAGAQFGLGGMILAVPVAAIVRVLIKEFWWDRLVASKSWNQPDPSRSGGES